MDYIKKNLNLIIGVIVFVFIATFIYHYVTGKNENVGAITEKQTSQKTDVEFRKMMKVLNELDKIKIKDNQKFFNKDFTADGLNLISFKDLQDFSNTKIDRQPTGKDNIFLDNENIQELGGFEDDSEQNSSGGGITQTTGLNNPVKVITIPN